MTMTIPYNRLVRLDVGDCFSLRDWTDKENLWYVITKHDDGVLTLTPADQSEIPPELEPDPDPEPEIPLPPPTAEEVAKFQAAAEATAAYWNISIEEAGANLANLFKNMVEHPIETQLYFIEYRLTQLENLARSMSDGWASIAAGAARLSVSSKL